MALNLNTFADFLGFAKRRKYQIIFPWLLISVVAVIVAYNLPKTYRSSATLLFEAPLPKLFEATVSQYADERIQSIYQRVMKTENVLSIIEEFGLYNQTNTKNTEIPKRELVDLFKNNTDVKLTATSFTPRSSSGMTEIAFDISFIDKNAVKAQEVASKLASIFIEYNDKFRTQRAEKATAFLTNESERLNSELHEIDNKIVSYKEQHNLSLPDQAQASLTTIDRAENELRDTESQIRITKERIAYLATELARTQGEIIGKPDEKVPQTKDELLRSLRSQYLKLSSVYLPSHPTMVRLKREIKSLDPSFDSVQNDQDTINQLAEAKKELKYLKDTYTGNHPDIAKLKTQIYGLEQQLKSASQNYEARESHSIKHSVNPAYVGLEAQYKTNQSELQASEIKRDFLKSKLEKMQNALVLAPQVEKEYGDLIRERDNTMKKYTELKDKLLEARIFQTQEEQQQGQTLTIIEPAEVPLHPEKAVRRKIAIGGFFMGLITGLGLAFLAEFLNPRLVGYRAIAEVTGLMPIVVIPYIETSSEQESRFTKQRKERKIIIWVVAFGLIIALTVYLFLFSPFM